jgi:hypothetical protein
MLRIDVDATGPYNIPPDNPFAGQELMVQMKYGLTDSEMHGNFLLILLQEML